MIEKKDKRKRREIKGKRGITKIKRNNQNIGIKVK